MFTTLKTLIHGANARAEEQVRDTYALELIDQKIREATSGLTAAKTTLASLIQRHRSEDRQVKGLEQRIKSLTMQAQEALKADKIDLATQAATSIAHMENELTGRRETLSRLDTRISRLQSSIETANRRLIDLKQGAITAKAVRAEQKMQTKLNTTFSGQSSMAEAEDLIAQVTNKDDPFEQSQILAEIDDTLSHADIGERMAANGFGTSSKTSTQDVLARLKSA